jgi:hypothetical protein
MKFSHLPIGARFEFEGKVYVKTGPIAASSEGGGQRMIPRYAMLRPLDGSVPVPPPKPANSLDEARVLAAFDPFYQECGRVLDEAVEDDARLDAARRKLSSARARFLASLGNVDRDGA